MMEEVVSAVSAINPKKEASPVKTDSSTGSQSSVKYSITSTPLNAGDHGKHHSELINAPIKEDDKPHEKLSKKNEKEVQIKEVSSRSILDNKLNLKNSTTLNLPNYKGLASLSMKTLEEKNFAKSKIRAEIANKSNEKKRKMEKDLKGKV